MNKIYIKARAKVNLTLNVLDKRPDGYHNLESIFQKITLYDELYISKSNSNNLILDINIPVLKKNNIIIKAYNKLKTIYKDINGVTVKLIKNIPMGAGLGGGSTDCAAFLIAMNKLFNLQISENEMLNLSKELGADVPPCLYDVALQANGIGEKISLIDTNFKYYILLVKPKFHCNTKEMFSKLDSNPNLVQVQNTSIIIESLKNNNIQSLSNNLYNIFELVVPEKKEIQVLKNLLIQHGALGASMTGSGSCVYGIFDNKVSIKKAYKILRNQYQVFLCSSYNNPK